MNMLPVESSQIFAIGYDADAQTLHIQFTRYMRNDAGQKLRLPAATYEYDDVPKAEYDDLSAAKSIGAHFHDRIKKGNYKFRKLDIPAPVPEQPQIVAG